MSNSKTQVINKGRRRVSITCPEETMTKQHHKEECDINTIVNQYKTKGEIFHINASEPSYGFAHSKSLHEMKIELQETQASFDKLPSKIRKRFENNMFEMLEFLENPENREEALAIGLIEVPDPTMSEHFKTLSEDINESLKSINLPNQQSDSDNA